MAEWGVKFPVDFAINGDKTNQAIDKHIKELLALYGYINQLRCNFKGAGYPGGPVVNQTYINPSTFRMKVYVGASGSNDWRDVVCVPAMHDLDKHNVGSIVTLQSLINDAELLYLATAPVAADSGKIVGVASDGKMELKSSATPSVHDYTKHSAMTMAQLQGLVSDKKLVYLAAVPTSADSAKIVSIDSNGNYILTSPAAQTDALNAPYEVVSAHGTLTAATTLAASDGNIHTFTVGAAITLTLNSNCLTGYCRTLTLVITNGGAYTITWPASVKWAGGAAPTFTASGVDVVTLLTTDGGTTWLGSANGVSYA